jgi:hypothetical protein
MNKMEDSNYIKEVEKRVIEDKIKALPVTVISINHWEDKKYKPYTVKLVKLDDVLKILELIKKLELE